MGGGRQLQEFLDETDDLGPLVPLCYLSSTSEWRLLCFVWHSLIDSPPSLGWRLVCALVPLPTRTHSHFIFNCLPPWRPWWGRKAGYLFNKRYFSVLSCVHLMKLYHLQNMKTIYGCFMPIQNDPINLSHCQVCFRNYYALEIIKNVWAFQIWITALLTEPYFY